MFDSWMVYYLFGWIHALQKCCISRLIVKIVKLAINFEWAWHVWNLNGFLQCYCEKGTTWQICDIWTCTGYLYTFSELPLALSLALPSALPSPLAKPSSLSFATMLIKSLHFKNPVTTKFSKIVAKKFDFCYGSVASVVEFCKSMLKLHLRFFPKKVLRKIFFGQFFPKVFLKNL